MDITHAFSLIGSGLRMGTDNLISAFRYYEKQRFYELKRQYFEALLKRSLRQTGAFSLGNLLDSIISLVRKDEPIQAIDGFFEVQKQAILKRLITLSKNLAIDPYNPLRVSELKNLENKLESYLDFWDDIILHSDGFEQLWEIKQYDQKIKRIKKILQAIVKKTKHRFIRDLRQFFRNKVNYLFKRLDDEADKKNELTIKYNSFFSLLNIIFYGHSKDCRKLRISI